MLSDIFDEVSSGSRFNLEEYKAHTIQQLQNTEGLTEEQARKKLIIGCKLQKIQQHSTKQYNYIMKMRPSLKNFVCRMKT